MWARIRPERVQTGVPFTQRFERGMIKPPYHGYPYEGVPTLIIWIVFFVGVLIFEEAARQILAWAFLMLMAIVTAASVVCEYLLYRLQDQHTPHTR